MSDNITFWCIFGSGRKTYFEKRIFSTYLVSTYVVCERLSVVHKQVSVHIPQTVNFCPNSPETPFWNFRPESPPPSNWKTSDLRWPKFTPEYPYPSPNWKTSDLRWPKFTPEYPPLKAPLWNFRPESPPPNGKLQIWDDQSLLCNTPPTEKPQIWDDQSLLRNTPIPKLKNFRFEMTKVYSGIPPQTENFRFEMTKVYSGIHPPPNWKTSDLRWPKFTPEYPKRHESKIDIGGGILESWGPGVKCRSALTPAPCER